MSGREHETVHRDLGVYVLGALQPAERDRFERHLAECDECRDELASLAPLPSLLTRAIPDPVPLPDLPAVGPVVERVAAERRRTRRRIRFTAAGAAVAAALALVGILSVTLPGAAPPARQFAADESDVTAAVEERDWGMAVQIDAGRLPPAPGYTAVAISDSGHRTQVASWAATGGSVTVEGACYLAPGDVARIQILAAPEEKLLVVLRPTG